MTDIRARLKAEIAKRVRERRAPPCPACGGEGTLAAKGGGADSWSSGDPGVYCRGCYTTYRSLKQAWLAAVLKRRASVEDGVDPDHDGPKGA